MIRPNAAVLRAVSLFAELDDEPLGRLAEGLRSRRYTRGQIIFAEGDPGTSLGIVASGRIDATANSTDGKELVLNSFGPGDVFGELALLTGEPRSADAVARETSQVFLLPRDDFLTFLEGNPRVAITLLAIVSRKLQRTTQQVQDVTFLDVPARLARALLDLAANPKADGEAPTFRVTQLELAARVGATRESVNKWLGFFADQGLIAHERGRVTILNSRALRQRIY
jgi:CRP-like cAMP-binding protein